jgi:hypothetical protein
MCAKSNYLLVTLHTEGDGINLDDYYGNNKENIKDDRNNNDEDEDNDNNKMGRRPAPPAGACRAGRAPSARCFPTRPVVPAAAAAVNVVDQLVDN